MKKKKRVSHWKEKSTATAAVSFSQWKKEKSQHDDDDDDSHIEFYTCLVIYFLFQFRIYLSSVHAKRHNRYQSNEMIMICASFFVLIFCLSHTHICTCGCFLFYCLYPKCLRANILNGFYGIFRILTFVNIKIRNFAC